MTKCDTDSLKCLPNFFSPGAGPARGDKQYPRLGGNQVKFTYKEKEKY